MRVAQDIDRKLREVFEPQSLEVVDQSHLHAGHAGAPETGESHFRVLIVSEHFEGLSRLERQRRVNRTLAGELAGPVHALSIIARTPLEDAKDR